MCLAHFANGDSAPTRTTPVSAPGHPADIPSGHSPALLYRRRYLPCHAFLMEGWGEKNNVATHSEPIAMDIDTDGEDGRTPANTSIGEDLGAQLAKLCLHTDSMWWGATCVPCRALLG